MIKLLVEMLTIIAFIAFLSIELFILLKGSEKCAVDIDSSALALGVLHRTVNGQDYCAYLGIPYAQPPVGDLRFEPPQPIPLWVGTKIFSKESNICVQVSSTYSHSHVVGNEDCLYLNVYARRTDNIISKKEKRTLLPVLLWIHGGSFNLGSANSEINDLSHIIDKNCIVVTINYRLGALGFLSLPSVNISGNAGLKDQQLAMKWIQQNIIFFGGDPNSVTLVGWSAGGASVSYHIYAESSKGLFHRAILMSGNMLNPWAFNGNALHCNRGLSKLLNVIPEKVELNKTLKNINATELISKFSKEHYLVFFGIPEYCFVPTFDNDFAIQYPTEMIKRVPASTVPVLIGSTSLEVEFNFPFGFKMINVNFPNKNISVLHEINQYLKHFLKSAGNYSKKSKKDFVQRLRSMADINYGIKQFIDAYGSQTNQSIFLYRFSFVGKLGHYRDGLVTTSTTTDDDGIPDADGAAHGDELAYLLKEFFHFNATEYNRVNLKREILTRKRMVEMWTNFIKFGNPIPKVNKIFNIEWPPYGIGQQLLNIDDKLSLEHHELGSEYDFWDSIYKCLYNCKCNDLDEYLLKEKHFNLS